MVLTDKSMLSPPRAAPVPPLNTAASGFQPPPPLPQATLAAAPQAGWVPASPYLIGGLGSLLWGKDSRWLTLDVCREFVRNKCCRSEQECRYAHPPSNVEVQNGRVMCCFDSIKGKCQRKDPPCKYLHPPQHLKEQLLQNGRNNLILKHLNMQLLAHGFLPAIPSLVYDMNGSLASYQTAAYTTQVPPIIDTTSAAGTQYVLATPPSTYYSAPSYPVMPFIPQQQQQLEQLAQSQVAAASMQLNPRCVTGSVGSTAGSELSSTSSDQQTECTSPGDSSINTCPQPDCCTNALCATDQAYCGSSINDLIKPPSLISGADRTLMPGAEMCPATVNLIPCPQYYSPVYIPNVASYCGSQPGVIQQGMPALKRPQSVGLMQDGKCNVDSGNPVQTDCITDRACNGYVMYPSYAPTAGYATMAAPVQHLTYLQCPVTGQQYSLPPQFTSPPATIMTRY